jgi:hypothetical protein
VICSFARLDFNGTTALLQHADRNGSKPGSAPQALPEAKRRLRILEAYETALAEAGRKSGLWECEEQEGATADAAMGISDTIEGNCRKGLML